MVGCRWWLIILLQVFSLYADVSIESSIDQNRGYVNFPIKGTLTVTAKESSQIDETSFLIEGKSLRVSLIKNVRMGHDILVSIYQFELEPKKAGLHLLPSISVRVDEKRYRSLPTSYSVIDAAPSPMEVSKKIEPSFIKLEAFVDGPSQLYVGERTTLVYRISFNTSIDLTASELPFIHTSDFLKIGDLRIEEEQTGRVTVQTISQVIEAKKIGTYHLGPSFVKGYAYQLNQVGEKEYLSALLESEAPAIQLDVLLFSKDRQPESFTGAIGKVEANLIMVSKTKRRLKQSFSLRLEVSGVEKIEEFKVPSLLCQPGFSGIFSYDEFKTKTNQVGHRKQFFFELETENSSVFEIPSIELSSFDPALHQYHIFHTPSIPLESSFNLDHLPFLLDPVSSLSRPNEKELKQLFEQPFQPLTIKAVELNLNSLNLPWYQTYLVLILLPFGSFIFSLYAFYLKKYKDKQLKSHPESLQLFCLALKKKGTTLEVLALIEKALLLKLAERGDIQTPEMGCIFYSSQEKILPFINLLKEIESVRYGLNISFDLQQILEKAAALLENTKNLR